MLEIEGPIQDDRKIMLFGGPGYSVYLGCLSCDADAPDSVFNTAGRFGNNLDALSIWNRRGIYGSRDSAYSAWNPHAKHPPRVQDQFGKVYGVFTSNFNNPNRVQHRDWYTSPRPTGLR